MCTRDVFPCGRHDAPDRAQSESIGVILLTAVIVILVGGFGVVYLGTIGDGGQPPLVDAEVNATDERVSITHVGGEALAVGELEVVLRGEDTSERYAVDPKNVSGGNDTTFDPGDRYRRDHGLGNGSVEVLLIHTASNAVIHEAHLDVVGSESTSRSEPPATFGHAPSNPTVGETVTFDAGSPSGDGDVLSYDWDWDGDGIVENSSTDSVVEHTFADSGVHEVTLSVVDDDGATNRTTRTVVVGPNPPSIEETTLTDGDDDLVGSGDSVSVSATVDPGSSGVDAVAANASAFDAGNLALTDGDGDGTYERTFDVGPSAAEGAQSVAISVTDTNGKGETVTTDDEVTVDTTAPEIETFAVSDESEFVFGLPWGYVESFQVGWSIEDPHLARTTVYVNRSGASQATFGGSSGDETYENERTLAIEGRDHTITIVAVDEVGNRACRTVTDTADGSDPPASAYGDC